MTSTHDFAEKLLASQRQFAEEVLTVMALLAASAHKADNGQKQAATATAR